jgi:hypothetical protein
MAVIICRVFSGCPRKKDDTSAPRCRAGVLFDDRANAGREHFQPEADLVFHLFGAKRIDRHAAIDREIFAGLRHMIQGRADAMNGRNPIPLRDAKSLFGALRNSGA